MRLIGLAVALAVSLTLAPVAAEAQQPTKIRQVGYLVLAPLSETPSPERAAFLAGLRELGWIEGKTIAIEYRSAKWNPELFDDLAEDLVRMKVDVIVTINRGFLSSPSTVSDVSPIAPHHLVAERQPIEIMIIRAF